MICDYILAGDLLKADHTAQCNGWKRLKHDTWERAPGKIVRYCANEKHLSGAKRGRTIVYAGMGWSFNSEALKAMHTASAMQLDIHHLNWTPLKSEKEKS